MIFCMPATVAYGQTGITISFPLGNTIDVSKDDLLRMNVWVSNYNPQDGYYYLVITDPSGSIIKNKEVMIRQWTEGTWGSQVGHLADDYSMNGKYKATVRTDSGLSVTETFFVTGSKQLSSFSLQSGSSSSEGFSLAGVLNSVSNFGDGLADIFNSDNNSGSSSEGFSLAGVLNSVSNFGDGLADIFNSDNNSGSSSEGFSLADIFNSGNDDNNGGSSEESISSGSSEGFSLADIFNSGNDDNNSESSEESISSVLNGGGSSSEESISSSGGEGFSLVDVINQNHQQQSKSKKVTWANILCDEGSVFIVNQNTEDYQCTTTISYRTR